MILSEFSKFLKQYDNEILTKKIDPLELLHLWLETILSVQPKTDTQKIIHKEILYCKNPQNDYIIIGKSESGRILVKTLIEFSNSYSNYMHSKWINMTEQALYSSNSAQE